jgi:hypothetical protein
MEPDMTVPFTVRIAGPDDAEAVGSCCARPEVVGHDGAFAGDATRGR